MAVNGKNAYHSLIEEDLAHEWQRKESLERRALAVITSSGALITLATLFAPAGLDLAQLTVLSGALIVSIWALVIGALLALFANGVAGIQRPQLEALWALTEKSVWNRADEVGERRVARVKIRTIESLRDANRSKAKLLKWSITLEVAGIAALSSVIPILVVFG